MRAVLGTAPLLVVEAITVFAFACRTGTVLVAQVLGIDAKTLQDAGPTSDSLVRHTWLKPPYSTWPEAIPTFTRRLRSVVIENRDAFEVMERMDSPVTLFYADPPYCHISRSSLQG